MGNMGADDNTLIVKVCIRGLCALTGGTGSSLGTIINTIIWELS
jgi:hypothetical protein